ncbi:MAG: cation diffusion facilitator family transporter [Candidatus Omnitrophota bacterium]
MNLRLININKVVWISAILNIFLSLLKVFAGIYGRSAAMIADAVHSLSDLATDVIAWLGLRVADRPADKSHNYGHGKAETLTSTIIGLVLIVVGLDIFWSSAQSILKSFDGMILPKPKWIAVYAAIVSIVTKEWIFRYSMEKEKSIKSQAIVANAWHHRSDALSSVCALIGISGAILLGDKWRILDPIAAVLVSLFICKIAITICARSINELLEASLDEKTIKEILQTIRSVDGAQNPHDMRTRRLGNNIAIDVHIDVNRTLDIVNAHDISTQVEKKLKDKFGRKTFVSIHIEPARNAPTR